MVNPRIAADLRRGGIELKPSRISIQDKTISVCENKIRGIKPLEWTGEDSNLLSAAFWEAPLPNLRPSVHHKDIKNIQNSKMLARK